MSEEEKTLKYLSAMRVIDFNKLGFAYGKETITEILNLIQSQQKEIEKKNKIIDMLFEEREHIKNNLEVDLNKKGIYSQAKGQISQILEYYKNNDKYFEKKVEGKQC